MPAFYSRSSHLPVDERVESAEDVADIIKARDALGVSNSILVTVPVPENAAIDTRELENILDKAVQTAKARYVSGRDVTPFLLAELGQRTKGQTLKSNIALLENNARVATEIARALA